MNPDELALAFLTGQLKDMSYLSPDPEIENSVMFRPPQQDIAEEAFFQPDDVLPWNTIAKAGLLGLALAGIKPVAKASNYLPDAVKLAQRRVVEPVVGAADDAATIAISDLAREMAEKQAYLDEFLPGTFYHGTSSGDFNAFKPGRAAVGNGIFFSTSPDVANDFAGGVHGSAVVPVKLRANNVFDYTDQSALDDLANYLNLKKGEETLYGEADPAGSLWAAVARGDFDAIETDKTMRQYLKSRNYDAFTLNEYGGPKNIAVYNPSQIRSIFAAFDPAKKDSADLLAGVAPLLAPTALAAALSQFGTEDQ